MARAKSHLCSSSSSYHSRLILILLLLVVCREQAAAQQQKLPPSQVRSLLRLQKLLEYPTSLSSINSDTTGTSSFCSISASSVLNISCNAAGTSVLVLQIVGDKTPLPASFSVASLREEDDGKRNSNNNSNISLEHRLSDAFSMETLGNLLSAFTELQVLGMVRVGLWGSLPGKLDHLGSLRVLDLSSNSISGPILDRLAGLEKLEVLDLGANLFSGSIPRWLGDLSSLRELDLSKNALSGVMPGSIFSSKRNLERLSVSHNGISGNLPESLGSSSSLRYLNAGANKIGPSFPSLNAGIEWILLGQNEISSSFPRSAIGNLGQARVLDLSYNRLSGNPPSAIFDLPSIETLALNGNELSGSLPYNLSLSSSLQQLDVSSNLFTGRLPQQLLSRARNGSSSSSSLVVRFDKNCFATKIQRQYTKSHCDKVVAAAAARHKQSAWADSHDLALIAGIVGGAIALVGAVAVFLLVLIRCLRQQEDKPVQCAASSCADTASIGVPSDLLSNARYLSQSIRLGVLGTPQNRVFSVSELEEATGNFSLAALIGEGQHGKVYKGKLQDGTVVAVKCLTLDSRQDMRQLKPHVELLVKIRHRHLVGYIGYCLERESEGPRLFLVTEYIDNGTLRNHLSRTDGKEVLNWPQRLAAVIGAGRGIQYLHTGVVPGIFNNDVNITNVLLDQNRVAKFTDFGLGRHARTSCDFDAKLYVQKAPAHIDLDHHRRKLASDKTDVHNFGFILLEIILGRPPTNEDPKAVQHPKVRELEMLMTENVPRFEVIDSAIVGTCIAESLTTVLEIAAKCLSEDASARPSMEDVLWNLQYAAQVQDRVSGEYTEDLPYVSPPRSRFNRQVIRTSSIAGRRMSGSGDASVKKSTPGPEFLR